MARMIAPSMHTWGKPHRQKKYDVANPPKESRVARLDPSGLPARSVGTSRGESAALGGRGTAAAATGGSGMKKTHCGGAQVSGRIENDIKWVRYFSRHSFGGTDLC